jgi:hypothetical protein
MDGGRFEQARHYIKEQSGDLAAGIEWTGGMPLRHGERLDRAGEYARPGGSFEGSQPADMVEVGVGDEDALQVVRGVSQTSHIAQDLPVAAGQTGVNQCQPIGVDKQVGVGDDVRDQVDIWEDFQNCLL